MADPVKKIEELKAGLRETEQSIKSLGTLLTTFNTTFLHTVTELTAAGKGLDGLVKKLGLASDGVKKAKKSFEHTWTDLLDPAVLKQMAKQIEAFEDLTVGAKEFEDRIASLTKKTDGLDIEFMDSSKVKEQQAVLNALERSVQKIKGSMDAVSRTKLGVASGAPAAVRDLAQAEERLKAIRMQYALVAKEAKEGLDFNTDPMAGAISKQLDGVRDLWDTSKKLAAEYYNNIKNMEKMSVSPDVDPNKFKKAFGDTTVEKVNSDLNNPKLGEENLAKLRQAAEDQGIEIRTTLVVDPKAKNAQEIQAMNDIMVEYNVPAEKASLIMQRMVAISKQEEVEQKKIKILMETKRKIQQDITKATLAESQGRLKHTLAGFGEGGFKGGMAAFAKSFSDSKKSILTGAMSMEDRVKLMNQNGFKASMNSQGGMDYEASGMNKISQQLSGFLNKGLKGVMENNSALKGSMSAAEGAGIEAGELGEAAGGLGELAGVAETAGGALEVLGAAFSAATIVVGVFIALFKLYAAAVDHTAEKYREVRSFGGVSGMGAGKTGILDLHKELYDFRINLAKGGGSQLGAGAGDSYYLGMEKRMDILKAASSAGMNAGRMQQNVKEDSFISERPEENNATAKYMQVSAEMAELLGKDLKEAAAEVANLHEELSMSFESVESFFVNITRSATAAGVSNEKFLKLTRSLANEQLNYGTQLMATSRILELLGASGAYTSETLKKAFESLVPEGQNTAQKTVDLSRTLKIGGERDAIIKQEQAALDTLNAEIKHYSGIADDTSQTKSVRDEAAKEVGSRQKRAFYKSSFIGNLKSHLDMGAAAALEGAELSTRFKIAQNSTALSMSPALSKILNTKGLAGTEARAAVAEAGSATNLEYMHQAEEVTGLKKDSMIDMLNSITRINESGGAVMAGGLFDDQGQKKALPKDLEDQLGPMFEKLGIDMSKIGTKDEFIKAMSEAGKDLTMGDKAQLMINATVALGQKLGPDMEAVKANTAASGERSTSEADKIIAALLPVAEEANRLLDAMVQSNDRAKEAYARAKLAREQQKAEGAAKASEAKQKGLEAAIDKKAGNAPSLADRDRIAEGKAPNTGHANAGERDALKAAQERVAAADAALAANAGGTDLDEAVAAQDNLTKLQAKLKKEKKSVTPAATPESKAAEANQNLTDQQNLLAKYLGPQGTLGLAAMGPNGGPAPKSLVDDSSLYKRADSLAIEKGITDVMGGYRLGNGMQAGYDEAHPITDTDIAQIEARVKGKARDLTQDQKNGIAVSIDLLRKAILEKNPTANVDALNKLATNVNQIFLGVNPSPVTPTPGSQTSGRPAGAHGGL